MNRTILALASLITLLVAPATQAQPSNLVSYQGYAEDGGTPVSGSHSLTIALYTAPVGGTIVYVEEHPPILFQDGAFGIALGSGNANGANPHDWDGLDFSVPYWISVDIDDTTLDPRTPLLAVPHARSLVAPALITGQVSGGNTVSVTNTATSGYSTGVFGDSDSPFGTGVSGRGGNRGVFGETVATTGTAWGVQGVSASTTGRGVLGNATATTGETFGVAGASESNAGRGVYGHATSTSGTTYGVRGTSDSNSGRGVYGEATAQFGSTYGVFGRTPSSGGFGVYGEAAAASGAAYGVVGRSSSTSGRGVYGQALAATGLTYGVYGESASTGARALYGLATSATGNTYGVWGQSASTGGVGIYGYATGTSGNTGGVVGIADASNDGTGVTGAGGRYGVYGFTSQTDGYGVYGESLSSIAGTAIYGHSAAGTGIHGVGGTGVYGSGGVYGVNGFSAGRGGRAVQGRVTANAGSAMAIFGFAEQPLAYAGYFSGRVEVLGTLSKGGGSFKIDHPLDPGNRILRHSFVESPDMMNVYNGNITTDGRGYATVEMPDYFEALNRDFRYQVTPISSFSRAMISEEVTRGRFVIRTEEPNVRVSWQVTGIRQDAWAEQNRIVVEEDKPPEQVGRYLYPTAFGFTRQRSIDYNAEEEERPELAPAPMGSDPARTGTE